MTACFAKDLKFGMLFTIFGKEYIVVYVLPNSFGEIVIRFVNSDAYKEQRPERAMVLIVHSDMEFQLS